MRSTPDFKLDVWQAITALAAGALAGAIFSGVILGVALVVLALSDGQRADRRSKVSITAS